MPVRTADLADAGQGVEYYNSHRDHYFVTASAADLEALDSGQMPGWQRTGLSFPVASTPFVLPGTVPPASGETHPVCRFYLPPPFGDSHFFSASAAECADVRERFPDFVLETDTAFYAALPDARTGDCAPTYQDMNGDRFAWVPVFRLWNGRADTNHRYTMDLFVRSWLIELGYTPEGYGALGVAYCVPVGV